MLDEDDPEFDNWDQDEAAAEDGYGAQDPAEVGTAMVERAAEAAGSTRPSRGRLAADRSAQGRARC